jgi:hypothetical protein
MRTARGVRAHVISHFLRLWANELKVPGGRSKRMFRMLPKLVIPAAGFFFGVVLLGVRASADTFLIALPDNAHENPPTNPTLQNGSPRPASFGTASFVLNDARTAMTMTVTVQNIDFTGNQTTDPNDNLTNAHIHASPTVTQNTNAPVVWGFFGSPFNDNNPPDMTITPFATGVGGVITGKWDTPEGNGTTLTQQIDNILTMHAYINFHTVQFPGGEIRNFLVVIPEPASAIALLGGAPLLMLRRRARRS